jgi:hypothetical protein
MENYVNYCPGFCLIEIVILRKEIKYFDNKQGEMKNTKKKYSTSKSSGYTTDVQTQFNEQIAAQKKIKSYPP